ncbi:MAG: hypothetical protein DIU71_03095 [Proteobacteria bacterium]|nr:MAG: hypothetical protein DIU71_03095 [Pseudomonadota bacterium]
MHRFPSERLLTIEEAERLSGLHDHEHTDERGKRRPSHWAWQTVDGALEQRVTDEQLERLARRARR